MIPRMRRWAFSFWARGLLSAVVLLAGTMETLQAASLEECVTAALKNNPDIQAGVERINAARFAIEQAKSAYYPRLYLAGSYAYTDNPPQAFMMTLNQRDLDMMSPTFDPNEPDPTDNMRLSVGLKYRLYNGGVNVIGIEMAEIGREVHELQLSAVRNELIHQVTKGYYGVLQAQAFVKVQAESVVSLEENLRVARERFKAGSAVKTDVLNLEVKLAQAREDLIRSNNGVQLAIASLNTAIGSDMVPPEGLPALAHGEISEMPGQLDYEDIMNRPELSVVRKMSVVKERDYKKSRHENYPTLDAYGSYDVDTGDLDTFEGSYMLGLMAEWEFFSGFQGSNKTESTKAEWQAAKYDEKKVYNNLRLDLYQAHLKANEAWQRLQVTRKSVESAEESFRITSERYKGGVADITVLLTAQVGLTTQKTRDVAAYYDYLSALSNLERARGNAIVKYAP
ncbi:MAG: TolC family protein [Deltaproteobacteria bacterium]|nr:TolC family protein [Deltaproteobacteria bacterium]